jgi:hypothetical protein
MGNRQQLGYTAQKMRFDGFWRWGWDREIDVAVKRFFK